MANISILQAIRRAAESSKSYTDGVAAGKLSLSGGTLTGDLTCSKYLKISAWPGYGTGDAEIWYDGGDGTLCIDSNSLMVNRNRVYHEGNKPTTNDIGAAPLVHNHNTFTAISGSDWASATRSITDDCKFEFSSHIVKGAAGLFPTDNNANTIISFNRHTGHYVSQLGFSGNGKIYYRYRNGAELTDNITWDELAFANHTHDYLPSAGGTITGNLTVNNNLTTKDLAVAGIVKDTRITTGNQQIFDAGASEIWLGNPNTTLVLESKTNPKINVGSVTNYALYHEGNKPTPEAIGAAPVSHGTHTDENVTNTLNNTTKFYLTGTTSSSTNTGKQIFDTGVYVTDIEGKLHVGKLESDGDIYPTTGFSRALGGSSTPWNHVYADSYNVYGETNVNYGYLRASTTGTTSTTGETRLVLGNDKAAGTAGNSVGKIIMHGTSTGSTIISPSYNSTSSVTLTLPSTSGTFSLDGHAHTAADVGALALSGGTLTGNLTCNQYLKINAWTGYGTGTADIWYDGSNATLRMDAISHIKIGSNKVYHEGNKPTAADVGIEQISDLEMMALINEVFDD